MALLDLNLLENQGPVFTVGYPFHRATLRDIDSRTHFFGDMAVAFRGNRWGKADEYPRGGAEFTPVRTPLCYKVGRVCAHVSTDHITDSNTLPHQNRKPCGRGLSLGFLFRNRWEIFTWCFSCFRQSLALPSFLSFFLFSLRSVSYFFSISSFLDFLSEGFVS